MIAADQETGPTPVERSVSIGTWNMDHWKRTPQQRQDAWRLPKNVESKSDVMLLQESVAPSQACPAPVSYTAKSLVGDHGDRRLWRSPMTWKQRRSMPWVHATAQRGSVCWEAFRVP